MKLWCFQDQQDWGRGLAMAAAERGHDAHLFDDPEKPDEGIVFMHMHHHPAVRLKHKRIMALLAMNPKLTLIPSYRASNLYDDKLEQAREFASYMPLTKVFWGPDVARQYLKRGAFKFPFISKATIGASSHNVRLIETQEQAEEEIRLAFNHTHGIPLHYGQYQRGYLLWQRFIPNNSGDIRIITIGRNRLILERFNRKNKPFASGSGKLKPITAKNFDARHASALEEADHFFAVEDQLWCGIDMVFDQENKRWLILETTVGWTLHGYYECEFYEYEKGFAGRMGNQVWTLALEEMERGIF